MSDNTLIEWADATVNAVNGCSVLSPGCTNCYAMRLAGTRLKHHPSREGLTMDSKAGPVWTGEVRLNEAALMQPLGWKRPRRIFWNAHGDLFHENVPDEWIDRVFAVCALTPQHTHMILTKRTARMREFLSAFTNRLYAQYGGWEKFGDYWLDGIAHTTASAWPIPNVWVGTSVEDQARADERIPDLLATPAAVRFLSCEPLLGALNLHRVSTMQFKGSEAVDALTGDRLDFLGETMRTGSSLDWVIVGGESGPGSRPMQNEWAQSIVNQCHAAGVAVFVKQLSSGGPHPIKDIEQFPEGLRVREYPHAR